MTDRVLVCGGAGYIGSTVCNELLKSGRQVIVVDNFCNGHREAIPAGCEVVTGDIRDTACLDAVLERYKPQACLDFAAFIEVGKSMEDPGSFFDNNSFGTLNLLRALVRHGVDKFVFSSTAAVYGQPDLVPISEDASLKPTNAYGESKLLVERMLEWFGRIHGLRSARLRYFNAAGNTPERGEDHVPESHLIPIMMQVALGQRPQAYIFGTDYDTADGTCVRDYVHILDLASAHILALEALEKRESLVYNLGNGHGFSVREIIESMRRVTGRPVPVAEGPRRDGDPAILVASSERIKTELGWKPKYADIDSIVASAWEWRSRHPNGYGS
ncbi:UDP-glucose 4-epimerase GalE [bacterium]|nr:UDP-glucose 4-epimerase GalE [bacterium]